MQDSLRFIKMTPMHVEQSARMLVRQIKVGPMANFVYLLMDSESHEALVVDSGWETGPILESAKAAGAKVNYAVASHEHFDHTSSLRELGDALGARVVAHHDSPIDCDLRVEDGDELRLGSAKVVVLHTPGHTEDSICLYDGSSLFTGDTLFIGTIGRFERPRAEAMYRSLHQTILSLPQETMVYPGHDYGEVPWRTLGEEKITNPFLLTRDLREFVSFFSRG
jgi:hydroxyacylglutathione hydrolase